MNIVNLLHRLPWGPISRAKRLIQKGAASYANGDFRSAARQWEKAQNLLNSAGESRLLAVCENSLGNAYQRLGAPSLALQAYERAHTLHRDLEDQPGEAADLANSGVVYQTIGNLKRAEEFARQALSLYQTIGKQAGVANQIGNLGNLKLMRGDLEGALAAYTRATDIHHQIGDIRGESIGLASQANVFRLLGDFSEALTTQSSALALARQIGDRHGEAEALGALGLIYQNQGVLTSALDHYELALAIRRRTGDRSGEIRDLINIGNVHRIRGDFDQAIQIAKTVLQIAQTSKNLREQALALAALGLAHQKKGDYKEAITFQSRAIEHAMQFGDPEILWRLYGGRGETYHLLNEPLSAYKDYRFAIQHVESVRNLLALQNYRLGYFSEERLADYEGLVLLLTDKVGLYRPDEALGYVERVRARTFLDLLAQTSPKLFLREKADAAVSARLNYGQPQSFEVIRSLLYLVT